MLFIKKKRLRGLTIALVVSIIFGGMPVYAQTSAATDEVALPAAAYSWNFESTDLGGAVLEGGATIKTDEKKGNVLYLPGGSAGTASLTLPEGMLGNLGTEGFTIAMWVKASSTTSSYTKLFDASNSPLGAFENGGTWWTSPDFALAAGGDVYDTSLYVGEAGKSTTNCSKLKYNQHLTRDTWQHMVVTVSPTDYKVYFDGKEITYNDAQQSTKAIKDVLPSLFADGYLASMKYASIGKSLYTSDHDFAGELDDVNFYKGALTAEQVASLYSSYNIGSDVTTAPTTEPTAAPTQAPEEALPTASYNWNFESADLGSAKLIGGAKIQEDGIKGNVLKLPGGSAGAGSMTLPEDMLGNLGKDGFTISMWVKPDSSTGSYTKLFDASNSQLGASNNGGTWWTSPDFALATGGEVYDATLYVGEAGKSTTNCSKLKYDQHLTKGAWQHMAVSVSSSAIAVYINGKEISYQDAQQSTKAVKDVLPSLFADGYLATMKYASIGQSLYTSDNDFAGEIDDVSFYAGVLDAKQIAKLFASYGDIVNQKEKVTMSVDMAASTGVVKHGATGFLYGIGENGVPSTNLMTAIKAYGCEQKPANGLQHPSGDFLETADSFIESGGTYIQIACPDIYANWPYEFESIPEYLEKLKEMVQTVKDAGYSDKAIYVPFNEPDGNWYTNINDSTVQSNFFNAWKQAYDAIKSIDPKAKIAGTNLCYYNDAHMKAFVQFCAENECIPDQITWHVLNDSLYTSFPWAKAQFRSYEKKYWIDAGLTTKEKEIVINEYADFTQLGVPGSLARWIGLFEDEKVSACLAYWHISNNLADLAADTNEPNGAWWLYKWYGEMSGNTLPIMTSGADKTAFYGVASLDENKKSSNVILGGANGTVTLTLKNVNQTKCFGGKVKVKLESTNWTGINGAADETNFIKEEICNVDAQGNVVVTIDNMVAAAAYNVTITKAEDSDQAGVIKEGAWTKTYEGEDAVLSGGAVKAGKSTMYACSGSGQAQGLNSAGDSVAFQVDVPQTGYYKYEMVYGAATGNDTYNTDLNNPKNAIQELYVDGTKAADMLLQNTLNWYMSGMHTEYIYLSAGSHALKVSATDSEGKATIDCMYLTYVGDETALNADKNVKVYEAELSDFNVLGSQTTTTVTTENAIAGYSDAGYVTGLNTSVENGGGIRFTTYAKENGLYDLTVKYNSNQNATINYYLGNTALTLNKKVAAKSAEATNNGWSTVTTCVYLQKGINLVDLDASIGSLAVDSLTVSKVADQSKTVTIEAEDCDTIGAVTTGTNTYASNGKYVKQFLAKADASNAIVVNYTAEQAGEYALTIYQSNKELFGKHGYNAQMVDRYITISVNEGTPFNVFFRNTYSDESFKSQVITVNLKKGANQIKIYNDDSRVLKNGVGGTNTCVNYTPNIDKFEITTASTEAAVNTEPTVTPTAAPTATPTAIPTAIPTAAPSNGSGVNTSPAATVTPVPDTTKAVQTERVKTDNGYVDISYTHNNENNKLKVSLDIKAYQTDEAKEKVTIPVTTPDLMKLLTNSDADAIDITMGIPTALLGSTSTDQASFILASEMLQYAKEKDKDINITISDEKGNERYTWSFDGADLSNSKQVISDINLALDVSIMNDQQLSQMLKDTKVSGDYSHSMVIDFAHEGILPSQAKVRIYVGDLKGIEPGAAIYLYHYNKKTGKLETLPFSSGAVVDEKGYLSLNILHCSDYVILQNNAKANMITSLMAQINLSLSRKTLHLSKDESAYVKVNLPSTLELVKSTKEKTSSSAIGAVVISYQSNNKKAAVVNKNGVITAKSKGKAIITATIKLYSGKVKKEKMIIYVK